MKWWIHLIWFGFIYLIWTGFIDLIWIHIFDWLDLYIWLIGFIYLIDWIHILDWMNSYIWLIGLICLIAQRFPLNDLVALQRAVLEKKLTEDDYFYKYRIIYSNCRNFGINWYSINYLIRAACDLWLYCCAVISHSALKSLARSQRATARRPLACRCKLARPAAASCAPL